MIALCLSWLRGPLGEVIPAVGGTRAMAGLLPGAAAQSGEGVKIGVSGDDGHGVLAAEGGDPEVVCGDRFTRELEFQPNCSVVTGGFACAEANVHRHHDSETERFRR